MEKDTALMIFFRYAYSNNFQKHLNIYVYAVLVRLFLVNCLLFLIKVGSDVFVCYKKAMVKADILAYKPGRCLILTFCSLMQRNIL